MGASVRSASGVGPWHAALESDMYAVLPARRGELRVTRLVASPRVAIVLGVDGGNSKTELLAVSLGGELLARVRGAGNNVHFAGVEATVDFLGRLVAEAGRDAPAAHGVFYL